MPVSTSGSMTIGGPARAARADSIATTNTAQRTSMDAISRACGFLKQRRRNPFEFERRSAATSNWPIGGPLAVFCLKSGWSRIDQPAATGALLILPSRLGEITLPAVAHGRAARSDRRTLRCRAVGFATEPKNVPRATGRPGSCCRRRCADRRTRARLPSAARAVPAPASARPVMAAASYARPPDQFAAAGGGSQKKRVARPSPSNK